MFLSIELHTHNRRVGKSLSEPKENTSQFQPECRYIEYNVEEKNQNLSIVQFQLDISITITDENSGFPMSIY